MKNVWYPKASEYLLWYYDNPFRDGPRDCETASNKLRWALGHQELNWSDVATVDEQRRWSNLYFAVAQARGIVLQ